MIFASVLAETAYHLRNSNLVLRLIETGLVRVAFDIESHRRELAQLAQRYADRQPDLADLCLIRMSELNPKLPVITVDGDFRIYRRNRRETIPVIMPPQCDSAGTGSQAIQGYPHRHSSPPGVAARPRRIWRIMLWRVWRLALRRKTHKRNWIPDYLSDQWCNEEAGRIVLHLANGTSLLR